MLPGLHRLTIVIACFVAFTAQAAPYDATVRDHKTPGEIGQWQWYEVDLRLRNDGERTWNPPGFHVSYHWFDGRGNPVVWDGERTSLHDPVPPGGEVQLRAKLRAPREPGSFFLQWDVVEESVAWLSEHDPSPPPRIPVQVVRVRPSHAFSVLRGTRPRIAWTSQTIDRTIELRNDGTLTWHPGGSFNLSYRWIDIPGLEGERTPIPSEVPPGDSVRIRARAVTPQVGGLHRFRWDMVHEEVTWFSQVDPTMREPAVVLVVPNPLDRLWTPVVVVLAGLGLALAVLRRAETPAWLVALTLITDLVWFFSALLAKQSIVFREASQPALDGSRWVAASGVAAVVILLAFLPRIIRPWLCFAVNTMISVILLADVVHLRFFGDVISVAALGAAGQTGSVAESIGDLLELGDLWLFSDLIPGALLALVIARLSPQSTAKPARWLALLLTPVLLPGLFLAVRISDADQGKYVQVFRNIFIVQEIGALNFHVFDAVTQLGNTLSTGEITPERTAEIESWFRSTAPQRAGTGPWYGVARGKNLVMIQVESMQNFVIDLDIDGQQITPFLNRWARTEAASFVNCHDQTGQGRTSDAEFATQTSLYPLPRGVVAFRYGSNRYRAMGDILSLHGYATISAIPFNRSFWNRIVTLPEYGYETNLFKRDFSPGTRVGWGLDDASFLAQMAARLGGARQPFGAFLITLSNHHPYVSFPDELKQLDLGELEGTSMGNYLHSMHHFDRAFEAFVEELERTGRIDDTVIALWGDHAAGFRWDQKFGDILGIRVTEPEYYRMLEVPFMVRVPSAEGLAGPRETRCGQVDVAPTLLALLGIDPARHPFIGRNLFGNPANVPVRTSYGVWLDQDHLYLTKGPELAAGRCYDVRSLVRDRLEECRDGDIAAKTKAAVSLDVVEHDLQVLMSDALREQ